MLSLNKVMFKSNVNASLSFENWALGQPNNFGKDQNFVSISYPNFKWGDWSGDTIGEVICQQEIKGKTNDLYYSYIIPAKVNFENILLLEKEDQLF